MTETVRKALTRTVQTSEILDHPPLAPQIPLKAYRTRTRRHQTSPSVRRSDSAQCASVALVCRIAIA
eukprot:scaffold76969_cov16-Prasinocladus_malaysianus.AAC.1